MKWIKTLMIVLATIPGITILSIVPVKTVAAFPAFWKSFWQRVAMILLDAFKLYLETVVDRGYFLAPVRGSQLATVFNNEADINMAAGHGLVYDGQSLTIPQDILIYMRDDVGVAIQKGEYRLDPKGNFNFNLIKVLKPVPSPTFPLPEGGD